MLSLLWVHRATGASGTANHSPSPATTTTTTTTTTTKTTTTTTTFSRIPAQYAAETTDGWQIPFRL